MNNIERLQKLSGIYITEAFGEKKYADHDKSGLQAVKKELQGILSLAARSSFKYKNAAEELKVVDACLKKLEEPEKKEVKESEEAALENCEVVLEKKDEDEKEDKDSDKKDDKDSDDKEDKKDKDDKDSDKEDDKEDDKPAFLKDKKDDKDSDDDKKDSDKEDKKDDEDDKEDDKPKKKDDDKEDEDDDEKTVKVEVKVEETVEDIVARILEKETPAKAEKVEVDYENGPVENSGVKKEQGTKVRLPADVKSEVNQRIKELNAAILRYDDKGYNDKSIKQQAIDCLNQILQDLSTNDMEGLKKAQIYLGTLMSPLTDFFPPKIINWLANASNAYVANESVVAEAALGEGEYQVAPVEKLPKGEYVKRKPDARKVYIVGDYDREIKRFSLEDADDIGAEIFVKPGTPLVFGFTY